jgi:hypothetical protein
MKEYRVKPLSGGDTPLDWKHDLLPRPPFRICVVAPSNTGKSVLTSYFIGSDEMPYKDFFKSNVFIFSPTFKLGSMDIPAVKKANIFDSFEPETVDEIVKEQEDLFSRFKKQMHLLFILDDVVSDLNQRKKDALKKLFFHGRHVKISVILLSQQYKAIPKAIRMNASALIIMLLNSSAERKSVSEEQPFQETKFLGIVDDALEDRQYSFLVVNYANPKDRKLQLRFSDQFYEI